MKPENVFQCAGACYAEMTEWNETSWVHQTKYCNELKRLGAVTD